MRCLLFLVFSLFPELLLSVNANQSIFLESIEEVRPVKELFLLTIPKSGTHLILKCLMLLQENLNDFPYKITLWHPGLVAENALDPKQCRALLHANPNSKKILHIRDLRDCYCSAIPYLNKISTRQPLSTFSKIWQGFETSEQKLLYLLRLDHPMLWDLTLTFKEMAEIMSEPNVFISHFERLVGPLGEGTKESQLSLISEISRFLELNSSKEALQKVADELFGAEKIESPELYFNEGKVGKWKKLFNEEHKEIFKKRAGSYLIFFGYEVNDNW